MGAMRSTNTYRTFLGAPSALGVLLGAACFVGALTPSLIPRAGVVQGALAGASFAAGYGIGALIILCWRLLHLPLPQGRRAVAALRERVQQAATGLIDDLAAAPSGAAVDVVESYCSQLPVTVIADILGVPEHERSHILEFGELAAPSLDIGLSWQQYLSVEGGLDGFNTWLSDHLRELRANPGDNLMSQLIAASEGGARLNDEELRATAGLVLAAGFETTVNLLGNGIRMLLQHPDQLALLMEQPDLWPGAVEEILRLESPVQLSARIAKVNVNIAGYYVLAGEPVIVYLAGANRDPAVFPDPHRFDVTRANAGKHHSFSGGRHFCLGAALARSEGEVGLRTFFERFPDAQLAGPGTRRDTRVLRGWAALPIALGQARAAVPS